MRSLWARIGLGAAAVFVTGTLLVTVVREAKSAATSVVRNSVVEATHALAGAAAPSDMPFRLAGIRIGTIRHLDIRRTAHGEMPRVSLEVDLASSELADGLGQCVLVPAHDRDFDPHEGFRCAEGTGGSMTTIGSVRFFPGDIERPIRVSRSLERELRRGDPFEATADLGGEVKVTARGDSGGIVHILADSHGASIQVRDGMERAILRMLADSTGASLLVRGDDGKVVRLEASQSGLVIRVDSAKTQ